MINAVVILKAGAVTVNAFEVVADGAAAVVWWDSCSKLMLLLPYTAELLLRLLSLLQVALMLENVAAIAGNCYVCWYAC